MTRGSPRDQTPTKAAQAACSRPSATRFMWGGCGQRRPRNLPSRLLAWPRRRGSAAARRACSAIRRPWGLLANCLIRSIMRGMPPHPFGTGECLPLLDYPLWDDSALPAARTCGSWTDSGVGGVGVHRGRNSVGGQPASARAQSAATSARPGARGRHPAPVSPFATLSKGERWHQLGLDPLPRESHPCRRVLPPVCRWLRLGRPVSSAPGPPSALGCSRRRRLVVGVGGDVDQEQRPRPGVRPPVDLQCERGRVL